MPPAVEVRVLTTGKTLELPGKTLGSPWNIILDQTFLRENLMVLVASWI